MCNNVELLLFMEKDYATTRGEAIQEIVFRTKTEKDKDM
jgi:hypothetical protein